MTKIDLITGLLGSGKTTFLLKYARHLISSGLRIAILVNDLGAVNVDMLMLSELKCESCQLEMIAGTADPCCHRRRFKTQLISLGMQHFDRVIIEPSGIFDMDEFFDILHESPLDNWFGVGSVIGVIAPESVGALTKQMEYLFASEAACCGKLVVSKLEDNGGDIAETLIMRLNGSLAEIKCGRRFSEDDVIAKNWDMLTSGDFDSIMSAGYRSFSYVKKYRAEEILSSVHYFMHISLPDDVIETVVSEILGDESCGRIFRIKGSLFSEKQGWLRINAMPDNIVIEPAAEGQPVLIVIGDDIDRQAIDAHLMRYNTDTEYVSI